MQKSAAGRLGNSIIGSLWNRSPRPETFWLAGVIALAALFRFWNLKYNPAWYHDECVLINQSWNLIHGHFQWDALRHTFLPRLPLTHLIVGSMILALGKHVLTIRIVTAMCGLLATWMIYRTARTFDRATGLLAAFYWATLSPVVVYNRWGFSYNLAMLECLMILLAIVLDRERGRWYYLTIATAGAAMSLVTEPASVFAYVAFLVYLIFYCKPRLFIYGIISALPLLGYIAFMLLTQRNIFLGDLRGIRMQRLSGPVPVLVRLDILRSFWTYGGFWGAAGFLGVFLLRPGRVRKAIWTTFLCWMFGLCWISGDDFALLFRQMILVMPIAVVGLARISLLVYWNIIGTVPCARPGPLVSREKSRERNKQGAKRTVRVGLERITKKAVPFVLAMLLLAYLYPITRSVFRGFRTQLDWLSITDPKAAEDVANFIGRQCRPDDIVMVSHLGWMYPCRHVSYMQASIADGGPGYAIFPAEIVADRFVFECSPDNTRFLVIHPVTSVFARSVPHVADMLNRCLAQWRRVYQCRDIIVYENPKFAATKAVFKSSRMDAGIEPRQPVALEPQQSASEASPR